MSRWQGVLFALLCLVLVSCGGSGGGVNGIIYTTDWTKYQAIGQIVGASQRVSLLNSSGLSVSSVVIQNVTAPVESTNFTGLADGDYLLQVELYSSVNAAGTQTGIFEYPITVSGGHGAQVNTSVGTSVDAIGVSPSQTSVQVGRGASFHAYGVNPAGVKTFLAPSSITWSVLGGIGSVTTDGNFTCNAVGTGSVRALYTNGKAGTSIVTGTSPVVTSGKWTILVYINGANDLQQYSLPNVNQMEKVAGNADVRFVVQWKEYPAAFGAGEFNGTRRYLIKPDTTTNLASTLLQDMGTTVDMGSPQTLHDFITWGKANFPADHYCLVIWNHGNGWLRSPDSVKPYAVSYDDQMGTSIQIWDLNQALGSEHFDIISWDASLMQMLEVAYEIKDNCDFVVGSEESPPGEGLPYDLVFAPFRDTPDASARTLSKSFVDGMLARYTTTTHKITQSVIDTSQLPSLATAVSALGTELKNNASSLTSVIQSTRSTAQAYSPTTVRYYRDLKDVCLNIEAGSSVPSSVLTATANVKTALSNAIVWEGHNSLSPNSTGISIDFSPSSVFAGNLTDYQKMKFAQVTQWDEFLAVAP